MSLVCRAEQKGLMGTSPHVRAHRLYLLAQALTKPNQRGMAVTCETWRRSSDPIRLLALFEGPHLVYSTHERGPMSRLSGEYW
jgi:hypothetical protein